MNERPPTPPTALPLPGMAAISLWMLALSLIGVVGVLTGHYKTLVTRIVILILCTMFAIAGLGLIRLRRWGWALTLAAVFLCMTFAVYGIFRFHQGQWIVMAVVNLVFFLYLVRPDILERLH